MAAPRLGAVDEKHGYEEGHALAVAHFGVIQGIPGAHTHTHQKWKQGEEVAPT